MKHNPTDAMDLLARTHDYFPASFRWRGQRFDVIRVERCWTVQGPALRRVFRVRCHAGSFELEQTVSSNAWRVRRAPWTLWLPRPHAGASPRFPLPKRQRRAHLDQSRLDRLAAPRPQLQPTANHPERSFSWTQTPQRTSS